MAELILTPEEQQSPSYLDWPDESLAKAVRGMALVLSDGRGTDTLMATTACCLLIKQILKRGSDELKVTLEGVTVPEHVGNWRVVVEKIDERPSSGEYLDTAFCLVCEQETEHIFRDSGHERDSSGDFRQCKKCQSFQVGHGDYVRPYVD